MSAEVLLVVHKLDGAPMEVGLTAGSTVGDLIRRIHAEHGHVGRILIAESVASFDTVVTSSPDIPLTLVVEPMPEGARKYLDANPSAALHVAAAHGLCAHLNDILSCTLGSAVDEPLKIGIASWSEALPDADPEIRGWVPKTPLQYASICHQAEAVKMLLCMKADPMKRSPGADNGCQRGHQAIHFCCGGRHLTSQTAKVDTLKALLDGGSTANQISTYLGGEYTPLHDAADSGSVDMVRVLLEAKADIHKTRYNDGSGKESALYLSLKSIVMVPWETTEGSIACTTLLLEHGAPTNVGFGKFSDFKAAAKYMAAGNDPSNTQPWDKCRKTRLQKVYPPPPDIEARIKEALLKFAKHINQPAADASQAAADADRGPARAQEEVQTDQETQKGSGKRSQTASTCCSAQ